MSDPLEDYQLLITSPGWLRLLAFVKSQWGASAYMLKTEKAIHDAEEKGRDALSAIKIVNGVSREVTMIMEYPTEEIKRLEKAKLEQALTPGRRGRA